MENTKYNGWTNYATWRINLELVDSDYYRTVVNEYKDLSDFRMCLQDDIEQSIDNYPDSFVKDYCLAFMSDVNWYEIAQHIWDDYREEEEEGA